MGLVMAELFLVLFVWGCGKRDNELLGKKGYPPHSSIYWAIAKSLKLEPWGQQQSYRFWHPPLNSTKGLTGASP